MNSQKKKVLIGMSGGVDSSVAAALLIEKGYECIGIYMNLWADSVEVDLNERKKFPQNKCCSIESLIFARSICQKLGMPFYSLNLEEKFKEQVVDNFLDEHRAGNTPNPCVRCNKTIKFGELFKKMEELGCDYLATGHYATLKEQDGKVSLLRGVDDSKDQTYFLYNLNQEKLKKLIFPIGEYNKSEVKELAKKFDLKELENKKESQGVCFYPEKLYFPFLSRHLKAEQDFKQGKIQTKDGEEMGDHKGLPFYTIGQRKGIGVGGQENPVYVNKIDKIKNVIIVGNEDELYSDEVLLRDVNFLTGEEPSKSEVFDIKIRTHGKLAKGSITKEGDHYKVKFEKAQRAIMAGQSLVLYRGKELLGGGIMTME
ncbi:tRNA 2-thiouridine(34) synthase MnmA [Candidatus Peregrinibacteria bacterium]|jgi:tRNA-uridine 2-sulfurtransferase|nr:tRNA 2-thiouridine(34) synthase MnmA [Candidatus Peregrinibacteria bacterium]